MEALKSEYSLYEQIRRFGVCLSQSEGPDVLSSLEAAVASNSQESPPNHSTSVDDIPPPPLLAFPMASAVRTVPKAANGPKATQPDLFDVYGRPRPPVLREKRDPEALSDEKLLELANDLMHHIFSTHLAVLTDPSAHVFDIEDILDHRFVTALGRERRRLLPEQ